MSEEQIHKIEERVFRKGIYFGNIAPKEWEWFTEYSNTEWCGNYGAALTAIIKGIRPPENTLIQQEITQLQEEIKQLKFKVQILEAATITKKEESRGPKMLNGKRLGET